MWRDTQNCLTRMKHKRMILRGWHMASVRGIKKMSFRKKEKGGNLLFR